MSLGVGEVVFSRVKSDAVVAVGRRVTLRSVRTFSSRTASDVETVVTDGSVFSSQSFTD